MLLLAGHALVGQARAATPKDTLVMAWNLDALITFDPAQIAEVNGNDIIRNVCDPLVAFDLKDVSKIVPAAAESWTTSPDGLTLTFKLRPDLKFPSGRPATAEDAVWSMQRAVWLGFGNGANLTQWGFTKDKVAQQITATDDRTIVVKMDRPYPPGLILSSAFSSNVTYILDKQEGMKNAKTVDGNSDYGNAFFKTAPICVGPYHVTRWNTNDVVILERNDNFLRREAASPPRHHSPCPGIRRRARAAGEGRHRRGAAVEHRRSEGAFQQPGHSYRADNRAWVHLSGLQCLRSDPGQSQGTTSIPLPDRL